MRVQNTLKFTLTAEEKKTLKEAAAIINFDGINMLKCNCGSGMTEILEATAQLLEQLAEEKTFTMNGNCIDIKNS